MNFSWPKSQCVRWSGGGFVMCVGVGRGRRRSGGGEACGVKRRRWFFNFLCFLEIQIFLEIFRVVAVVLRYCGGVARRRQEWLAKAALCLAWLWWRFGMPKAALLGDTNGAGFGDGTVEELVNGYGGVVGGDFGVVGRGWRAAPVEGRVPRGKDLSVLMANRGSDRIFPENSSDEGELEIRLSDLNSLDSPPTPIHDERIELEDSRKYISVMKICTGRVPRGKDLSVLMANRGSDRIFPENSSDEGELEIRLSDLNSLDSPPTPIHDERIELEDSHEVLRRLGLCAQSDIIIPKKGDMCHEPPSGYFTTYLDYFSNGFSLPPNALLVEIVRSLSVIVRLLGSGYRGDVWGPIRVMLPDGWDHLGQLIDVAPLNRGNALLRMSGGDGAQKNLKRSREVENGAPHNVSGGGHLFVEGVCDARTQRGHENWGK
ncbi:hypothetical protein F511_21876 [Dorcoceras hygrometricum]|uniref:Uncharacterized protein n=1 Tax=Dorcoceras hygrometricum TaxID=472368 RepID=A0A2Z7AFV9_9LAMI|nr:hypothetical protein F511_21876 [Dorcoceras hygrometricum]